MKSATTEKIDPNELKRTPNDSERFSRNPVPVVGLQVLVDAPS